MQYSMLESYRSQGWCLVALKGKSPALAGWERRDLDDAETWERLKSGTGGVGVVLGTRSGGLIDIDLDCPAAVELAEGFLPKTGAMFGHMGSKASHYLYYVDGQCEHRSFRGPDKDMLVEHRGEKHQTRIPPSDDIVWMGDRTSARVNAAELMQTTRWLALASALVPIWRKGHRHELALALSGFLKRCGAELRQVEHLFRQVCRVTQDEELGDRLAAAASTYAQEGRTTGLPTIGELVGEGFQTFLSQHFSPSGEAEPKARRVELPYSCDDLGTYKSSIGGAGERMMLANFRAKIVKDRCIQNGRLTRRTYGIVAAVGGKQVAFDLDAQEFPRMEWVSRELGSGAICLPRKEAELRTAIQALSDEIVEETGFGHTGWIQGPDGGSLYLHSGGAIGPRGNDEAVMCVLPAALSPTRLEGAPTREDVQAVQRFSTLEPRAVTLPCLAAIARAPIGACGLNLFIVGLTGTRKTAVAALAQSFFGRTFDARSLPATFSSTMNSLEELAHLAKDSLTVVDDYRPSATPQDSQTAEQVLDRLVRGSTAGVGRHRATRDGQLLEGRAPRSTLLITGESAPVRESLLQRMVILRQGNGVSDLDHLSACQDDAAAGCYERTMAGYVSWIARNRDVVLERVVAREQELIRSYRSKSHGRIAHMNAQLLAGLETFGVYLLEAGLATEAEVAAWNEGLLEQLTSWRRDQAEIGAQANPLQLWRRGITEALASASAYLDTDLDHLPKGITPEQIGWKASSAGSLPHVPGGTRIGFIKDDELYLLTNASLEAAATHLGTERIGLPTTSQDLLSLIRSSVLLPSPDSLTTKKSFGGSQHRTARLPLNFLFPHIADAL